MKRIVFLVLTVFCAAQVFAQVDIAQTGVIKELTGTVELKASNQARFVPARAGDPVFGNTIISTGFKSTALVTVGSAVLTVRPLTRLSLSEISASAGTETLNVGLQTGRVRVDVNPPAGTRASMSISSPVATASVRGTSFEFDTQSITVEKGRVAFKGAAGRTMLVGAGAASEIDSDGKATDPFDTGASDFLPPLVAGEQSHRRQEPPIIRGSVNFALELR